jgi:beta-lactamase superfamily II metal-dependent hydrolase
MAAKSKAKPHPHKTSAHRPATNPPPSHTANTHGARSAPSQPTVAADSADDSAWTPQGSEVGIRVRMYRVGFGDFFLVTCQPKPQDYVHFIIDCGVFKGTSQTGDIGSIELAVANMAATVKDGEIALIMCTHRHADHIAGFARCAETFRQLTVQAVWMSIWESQYPQALKFQADLVDTAAKLQARFAALGAAASEDQNTARKFMENATGETGAGSNANALNLLKSFPGAPPSYYQGGQNPVLPPAFQQAGISARILGPPPIADVQLMKLMDLQKGVGQYLDSPMAVDPKADAPFGTIWEVDVGKFYPPEAFAEWCSVRGVPEAPSQQAAAEARQLMQSALQDAQPDAALVAAADLNSFLNNQSLVVLFTFKGKNLLFVGDAQAGNWEHWIFATDDPDKKASGTISEDAQKILTNLDFYKVGHHGSGNATPIAVVNLMNKASHKFPAMCSTQEGVYGKENPHDPTAGTEVPRIPLLNALGAATALVRSDQIAVDVPGDKGAAMVNEPLPNSTVGTRFQQGALWIDCYL